MLVLLAGCGGGDSGTSGSNPSASLPSVSEDPALAAKVPSGIASDSTITVGTDATYAPSEFLAADGSTVEGFDVDLFDAVAAKLGLGTKYVPAPFGNIIPSVQSGKYEIGVSSFTINPDRVKVVDMVRYYSAGTAWATQTGNPSGITVDKACGHRVAVQRGTVQVDDVTARSTKCTAAGDKAISIDQYQGQDQATAAVVSGKDDAMLADSPVIAYAVKQTAGKLEPLGDIYDSAPYGYVVKKGEGDFAQALAEAVNQLIADGTYAKVLSKWGVEQGAVDSAQVNPSAP
ncbi:ABC transporter substrate-binding protein [Nocardioides mesophilus]|nr:ABC transporter substrate-binding protein [Nocardioides mesophilus]